MEKKDKSIVTIDQDIIEQSESILSENLKIKISTSSESSVSTISFSQDEIRMMKLDSDLVDKKQYHEPSKWIDIFNERHKFKFIYKTDSVTKDGSRLDMNTYKAFVRTSIKELGLSKHFSKQVVDDIILLWTDRERRNFLNEMRTKLSFQSSKIDHIAAWAQAATGKNDKLDNAVMRHFVWQIKRKLYGLEVQHHMMPILYGKSGGGKSQAVLKLLKPMDEIVLNMDLSIFSDQFKTRLFTKAYIMFFDEMAKSDRADIDRLKNIITSPVVDFRGMHTENLESAPQNCTFIGCSNDAVYDKIYDPTSARRYWQINCADKLNWSAINSIDYLALWKSVDENSRCPIIPNLVEISDIQDKTIRSKDLIEDWIEAILTKSAHSPKTNPSSLELYDSFKKHCAFQKINNVPTFNRFSRRFPQIMQNLKWNVGPYRGKRGTVWAVNIDPSYSSQVDMQDILDVEAQMKAQAELADVRAKEKIK